jgi:Flp pilus assembly protein TadD
MRTFLYIAVGFSAGFAVVYALVSRSMEKDVPPSPGERVAAAIALLEADPAAYLPETQTAVRDAAAAAAAGGVDTAEGWYVLALQYRREQNLESAEALYKRAIALRPDWSWPWTGLGVLLAQHSYGREDEAKEALHAAMALDPEDGRPCNMLAVILRMEGDYEGAEEMARRAIALNPDDIAMHNNYANLMILLGRDDEAEKHYAIATELNPDHPKPWYNLACLRSLQGRHDEAVAFLEQAVALAPVLKGEVLHDPDLAALQDHPGFQRLVFGEMMEEEAQEMEAAEDSEAPVEAEEAEDS